jgi:hypothetical protein
VLRTARSATQAATSVGSNGAAKEGQGLGGVSGRAEETASLSQRSRFARCDHATAPGPKSLRQIKSAKGADEAGCAGGRRRTERLRTRRTTFSSVAGAPTATLEQSELLSPAASRAWPERRDAYVVGRGVARDRPAGAAFVLKPLGQVDVLSEPLERPVHRPKSIRDDPRMLISLRPHRESVHPGGIADCITGTTRLAQEARLRSRQPHRAQRDQSGSEAVSDARGLLRLDPRLLFIASLMFAIGRAPECGRAVTHLPGPAWRMPGQQQRQVVRPLRSPRARSVPF